MQERNSKATFNWLKQCVFKSYFWLIFSISCLGCCTISKLRFNLITNKNLSIDTQRFTDKDYKCCFITFQNKTCSGVKIWLLFVVVVCNYSGSPSSSSKPVRSISSTYPMLRTYSRKARWQNTYWSGICIEKALCALIHSTDKDQNIILKIWKTYPVFSKKCRLWSSTFGLIFI